MTGALEKYQSLGLRQSLSLSYRYPMACRELSVLLRLVYSKSTKSLQILLFEDTIFAFRLLPQMQTQSAVSAANLLIQSAEAALPKQKRGLAAAEFKQSKIAYKRRAKGQQEDKDLIQLPQDVLVHVFSFLDMQSLVSTGLVCWSWNEAANDSYLWQLHYNTHFGELESTQKTVELQGGCITSIAGDNQLTASDGICQDADYDWKDAFRRAYIALSPCQRYKYFRGYCVHCNSIVWLKNLKCPNQHPGRIFTLLNLLSSSQIAMYILGDNSWWEYSSDSDSESDDEPGLKFWTYTWPNQARCWFERASACQRRAPEPYKL